MGYVAATTVLSHWNHRIDGMQQSANEFYTEVERVLAVQNVDKIKAERVNLSEGGIFTGKREYLQIRRGEQLFHVCAAPFGNGFFISSWLGVKESGFWAWLAMLPGIGFFVQRFLKPLTYYKIDTSLMFQSITHGAIMEVVDALTKAKGLRSLTENERKPVMRDFFANIGG